MPDLLTGFWELLALLLLNSLLAAARSAFVNASRPRLRQLKESGQAGAALALRVAEAATPLIATLRLGQTVCRFFAAGLAALVFTPALASPLSQLPGLSARAETAAFFIILLSIALLVVSLGEVLPEALVLRNPEGAAVLFAPLVAALEWVLAPAVRWLLWLSNWVTAPLAGQRVPLVTEAEIKTLVDAGEEGGAIEEDEKEMIYSIFDIGDTLAREIMVPRTDVQALEVNTLLPEVLQFVLRVGHSRIPVYQDNIDHLVGLLYARDLLRAGPAPDGQRLADFLRPVYFVPETKKVNDLLAELQQQRVHMAVVVDEYGGVAGLVTLEDIVEEIVGEIRDEYDGAEEALSERVGAGEYIFDARIPIDEVNELCQLSLPDTEGDSLGGFIYGQLGHIPAPGEKLAVAEAEFEVLSVTGRRIRKVRVQRRFTPAAPESAPPQEDQPHV